MNNDQTLNTLRFLIEAEKNQQNWPDYRIGAWAPGGYICRCSICNKKFMGDKRSTVCYPCVAGSFAKKIFEEVENEV